MLYIDIIFYVSYKSFRAFLNLFSRVDILLVKSIPKYYIVFVTIGIVSYFLSHFLDEFNVQRPV